MGGWFNQEINSLSDLNGLKMRILGLGGKVMSELGVNVQVLGGGEVYLALERGVIDQVSQWNQVNELSFSSFMAANTNTIFPEVLPHQFH